MTGQALPFRLPTMAYQERVFQVRESTAVITPDDPKRFRIISIEIPQEDNLTRWYRKGLKETRLDFYDGVLTVTRRIGGYNFTNYHRFNNPPIVRVLSFDRKTNMIKRTTINFNQPEGSGNDKDPNHQDRVINLQDYKNSAEHA